MQRDSAATCWTDVNLPSQFWLFLCPQISWWCWLPKQRRNIWMRGSALTRSRKACSVSLYLWRACSGWSHCACRSNTRPARGTGTARPATPVRWQPPETHTRRYIYATSPTDPPPDVGPWREGLSSDARSQNTREERQTRSLWSVTSPDRGLEDEGEQLVLVSCTWR